MTEPLVAYRLWEIADGPQLRSAHGELLWEVGWTRASCHLGHRAPDRRCHCGLFAYFDLHDTHQVSIDSVEVLGAVLAAGRVQIHERGLRAEYMRPIAFESPVIVPDLTSRRPLGLVFLEDLQAHRQAAEEARANLPRLAETYGVPIFDNDEDLELYLREWR